MSDAEKLIEKFPSLFTYKPVAEGLLGLFFKDEDLSTHVLYVLKRDDNNENRFFAYTSEYLNNTHSVHAIGVAIDMDSGIGKIKFLIEKELSDQLVSKLHEMGFDIEFNYLLPNVIKVNMVEIHRRYTLDKILKESNG